MTGLPVLQLPLQRQVIAPGVAVVDITAREAVPVHRVLHVINLLIFINE